MAAAAAPAEEATEFASAKGKKDYDWSHLAAKYWPDRVDDKCQRDPSLGVAHGCFWRTHPEPADAIARAHRAKAPGGLPLGG